MQRVSPRAGGKGDDTALTLDLSSTHCNANNCGAVLQLQSNLKYFFTCCGHVLCERCKISGGVQCPVCRASLKVMELSTKMEPNVRMYFEEPSTKLGQDLSRCVSEKINQLRNVIKFQKSQRESLIRGFAAMEAKNKKLAAENVHLVEKVKDMSGRLLMLEKQRSHSHVEQPARLKPQAVVSPDTTRRALFQNSVTPARSNIGHFVPAGNFETPVAKEPARATVFDRFPPAMKNAGARISNMSQNRNEGQPTFNNPSAKNFGFGNQLRQQQSEKLPGGIGTFRTAWAAATPTAKGNWSPASVSSYQFARKF